MRRSPRAPTVALILLVVTACTGGSNSAIEPEGSSKSRSGRGTSSSVRGPKWLQAACGMPVQHLRRIQRGYFRGRSPDIQVVPRIPNFFGGFGPTTHSGPWPYLQRVPFVFYGPGFIEPRGSISIDREVTVADLAPTIAALLNMPWPEDRAGRAVTEILTPPEERPQPPKLILTVVWDGGGWNVLRRWPGTWPNLRELMAGGSSVTNAIVGSSPTVTPAVHATIGTGVFPQQHGIVDIPLRLGDRMVDSWEEGSPRFLRVPTLADLYDVQTSNEAKVGVLAYETWHWAMAGHGSFLDGGDKDIAVIADRDTGGVLVSNRSWYRLPSFLPKLSSLEDHIRTVDAADGEIDSSWLGNEILNNPGEVMRTPPWVLYQTDLIKTLLDGASFGRDDVPDLFFTNYKQIDEVGHLWNMLAEEMPEIIRHTDDSLGELVRHLDEAIGEGNWVLVMTADHGQTPTPLLSKSRAWPISNKGMAQATAEHFGLAVDDLFLAQRVTGFWVNRGTLAKNDIRLEEISNFLLEHTIGDNGRVLKEVPKRYQDRMSEPVFEAVFPSKRLSQIIDCAKAKT